VASELERIRKLAGVSRAKAAVRAGVSEPLARLFEAAGPDEIKDLRKRAALVRVYSELSSGAAGGGHEAA